MKLPQVTLRNILYAMAWFSLAAALYGAALQGKTNFESRLAGVPATVAVGVGAGTLINKPVIGALIAVAIILEFVAGF